MKERSEFEVRELAQLVGTNPRRVEGWVEKRFITPVAKGRGPGRRRVFDRANLFQAALLVELLSTLGERSRAVGRIVREVGRRLKDELRRRVVEEAALLTDSREMEILWIELERKGGVRVRLLGFKQTGISDLAGRALRDGGTVVLLNITRVLAELGGRLAEWRR